VVIGCSAIVGIALDSSGQNRTIVGTTGFYYSNNYGQSFTIADSNSYNAVAVSANGQYQTAVGPIVGVYGSTSFGANPFTVTAGFVGFGQSVAMSASGQYQIAGSSAGNTGYINVSNSYGLNWYQPFNVAAVNAYTAVASSASGQYQIALNGNTANYNQSVAYMSKNYGKTWYSTLTGYNYYWTEVAMSSSGQNIMAAGADGWPTDSASTYLFSSNNFGSTWVRHDELVSSESINTIRSIAMSSSGQYQIATRYNNKPIISSTSYGAVGSWKVCSGVTAGFVAMTASGQTIVGAIGSSGLAISTDNQLSYQSFQSDITTVSPSIPSFCQNFGLNQALYTINNGTSATTPNGIAMSTTGQYIYVGFKTSTTAYSSYVSSNFGASWSLMTSTTTYKFDNFVCSANGKYILASSYETASGIYLSTTFGVGSNGGFSILPSSNGIPSSVTCYTMSMSASGQYMFLGTSSGNFITKTYGVSVASSIPWNNITGFTTFPNASQYPGNAFASAMNASGSMIIVTEGTFSTNIYFMWISYDYGVTWAEVPVPFSAVSLAMSATGQYISVSAHAPNSMMFCSTDYGKTWNPAARNIVGNVRGLKVSATGQYQINPGNGYYSTNFGFTWSQYSLGAGIGAMDGSGQNVMISNFTLSSFYRKPLA
jgi:hypothetical protein